MGATAANTAGVPPSLNSSAWSSQAPLIASVNERTSVTPAEELKFAGLTADIIVRKREDVRPTSRLAAGRAEEEPLDRSGPNLLLSKGEATPAVLRSFCDDRQRRQEIGLETPATSIGDILDARSAEWASDALKEEKTTVCVVTQDHDNEPSQLLSLIRRIGRGLIVTPLTIQRKAGTSATLIALNIEETFAYDADVQRWIGDAGSYFSGGANLFDEGEKWSLSMTVGERGPAIEIYSESHRTAIISGG